MPCITSNDGKEIWYDVVGKGEPLVLIGGSSLVHRQWDFMLPMLQDFGDWFQQEIGDKYNGTRCKDIAGDLVGTPEVKQICGSIIFQTFSKLNEILADNNYI